MSTLQIDSFSALKEQISLLDLPAALSLFASLYPGQLTFSTSFSNEDQVITHLIARNQPEAVRIFTLDTGRLFHQTYATWAETLDTYDISIKAYYPDQSLLEPFIEEKGPNSFYVSVDNRKTCCAIRKVEPLKRALEGNAVWITGLRAEHSPERADHQVLEWDEVNGIIKYNPLLHWTTEDVISFIRKNHIPYNTMFDKGFVSIGCEPCTRAIQAGEPFRAGRWWWEDASKKECGLHVKSN
jgi:phosphoadenosine phosphosulfate reductase